MGYVFSDPKINLNESELNDKERRVLAFMRAAVQPVTIPEIAGACFPGEDKRGYFWAKNQLRRLVVARFVKQIASGVYQAAK